MKKIIFLILLVVQSWAQASTEDNEESWRDFDKSVVSPHSQIKLVISPFAVEKRIEAETNPVFEAREPMNFSFGVRLRRNLFTLEYSRFSQETGNATFNVHRKFEDLLGWYRYSYWSRKYFRAHGGLGAGTYTDTVTTSFYEEKQELSSGGKWTAAVGLGVEIEPISWMVLMLEARLIAGQNLDPNPNADFLARLSFQIW